MNRTFVMLAVAGLLTAGTAFAQQNQPATQQAPKEGSVNDRRQDQQQRIANGVQSGQLTLEKPRTLNRAKPI